MARYKVVPTKTNLARLRRDMNFAQEGYELLEQKRQILVVELMGLIDRTADAQEKVEKSKGEEDQRVTFLKLTKRGKALLRKIEVAQREIINEVLKGEDLEKLELTVSQFEIISEKWLALAKEQMEKESDG